jgi:hypothetical protein
MEEIIMKAFLKGLLTAFVGFAMIAILAGGLIGLVGVWFLEGYAAVAAFIGSLLAIACNVWAMRKIGKGGAYAEGNV